MHPLLISEVAISFWLLLGVARAAGTASRRPHDQRMEHDHEPVYTGFRQWNCALTTSLKSSPGLPMEALSQPSNSFWAAAASSISGVFTSYWHHRQLILQMARRDVIGRYRGSILGVAWSFLTPLLMLLVYPSSSASSTRRAGAAALWRAGSTSR